MTRFFLFALIASIATCSAGAQQFDEFGFSYELETQSSDTQQALPMIIAMHYMGGSPDTSREDYANVGKPARIVLMQGPYETDGGYSWFPDGYYEMEPDAQAKLTLEIGNRLAQFIHQVTRKYNTKGKPIVTGYSQGADLSHVLALHHGNAVRAILPMGARFEPEWLQGVTPNSPMPETVVLFHGEVDRIVSIDQSVKAGDYYRQFGVSVVVNGFPNTGHAYPAAMKQSYERVVRDLLGN